MIYVGIDVAKFSHFASAVNSDGEILINPFPFKNDQHFSVLCFYIKYVPGIPSWNYNFTS